VRRLQALLLVVIALLAPIACSRDVPAGAFPEVRLHELPPEALRTLALIKRGGPFPYGKDGSVFGNREGRLPSRPRGYYTEYTVPTPQLRDRGPRRIVAGSGSERDPATSGEYFYTDDHYNTFRRIRE
jgi:ribonuclease T1